jgi:glycosyltransferase involved in cell wall biosynthesis
MYREFDNQELILFTSSNFPTGGAGAAYLNLFCKGMMSRGHLIRVYLTRGHAFMSNSGKIFKKNKTSYGVSYEYLGLSKRSTSDLLKLADEFLSFFHLLFLLPSIAWKRKRITIFVYNIYLFHGLLLYLTTYLFKVRMITFVSEHFYKEQFSGFINKLNWYNFIFTFKHLNPLSDRLIVFSQYLRDIYIKKGFKEDRIFVQPNLTDFEFWQPIPIEERYIIGYSGTPSEKDGIIDLFKAISLLKDQLKVSLIVVGDSTFGKSLIPGLEVECENLGIKNLVQFTGLVDYNLVKTWLSQCKYLAITRPRTIQTLAGFPIKLGEYMALKKPVLATDFGEVETYFNDGEEIIIAKSGDPESIADRIRWMFNNEEQINSIAVMGYNKAYKLLEYNASITRIISFLRGI